jgi:hypothetical protein
VIRQSHDAEHRKTVAALKRQIEALTGPDKEAARKARRDARKARQKAIGKPGEGQRQPRVEDPQYLSWVRGLPCVICVQEGAPRQSPRCEAAHVRFADAAAGWSHTGKGEKPDDRRTVPLCAGHHRTGPKAQHGAGERAWWEGHGIYPPELCRALSDAFDHAQDGAAVILSFSTGRNKASTIPLKDIEQ